MPLLLWILGGVTTVTGLVLVASGFPIRDGTFDAEILTPGMIAIVGGLLLAGLGLAVRELRRIEHALVSRPMPRITRSGEAAAVVVNAPDASVHLPIPLTPKIDPQPAPVAATDAAATSDEATPERVRVKFPVFPLREDRPLPEAAEVSLTPHVAAPVEDDAAEVASAATVGRAANGTSGSSRVVPRPRPRPSAEKTNGSGPREFWPLGPLRDLRAAPAKPAAIAPGPAVEPPPLDDVPEASTTGAPTAPTVLKSGVVEGMAYTLYSDGSIDAALPQGTLRFGSISALRDHIENTP